LYFIDHTPVYFPHDPQPLEEEDDDEEEMDEEAGIDDETIPVDMTGAGLVI